MCVFISDRASGSLRKPPTDGAPSPAGAEFMDAAFANEMARLVIATKDAFLKMMFRDGLKSGFYDFQASACVCCVCWIV